MKPHHPLALASLLLLGACQQSPPVAEAPAKAADPDQQWNATTLSPDTIAKANAAVADYRACLVKETSAKAKVKGDSRDIANTILKACEDRLPAIKAAYDAENVPAALSERYIRKTRNQGVQAVMFQVQSAQALLAAQEEEAKRPASAKKAQPHPTKTKPNKGDPE